MPYLKTPDEVEGDFSRRYTLEEFWALPKREDGGRYELIEGYIYLIPPPEPIQRIIAARMGRALSQFLIDNNVDGEVYSNEPIYRRSEDSTDLGPDLM